MLVYYPINLQLTLSQASQQWWRGFCAIHKAGRECMQHSQTIQILLNDHLHKLHVTNRNTSKPLFCASPSRVICLHNIIKLTPRDWVGVWPSPSHAFLIAWWCYVSLNAPEGLAFNIGKQIAWHSVTWHCGLEILFLAIVYSLCDIKAYIKAFQVSHCMLLNILQSFSLGGRELSYIYFFWTHKLIASVADRLSYQLFLFDWVFNSGLNHIFSTWDK